MVGFRIGGKFLQGVDGQIGARDQYNWLFDDQSRRGEIGDAVVKRRLVHGRNDGHGIDAGKHELVSVWRRFRHPRCARHATCATDIFNDDLLSKCF